MMTPEVFQTNSLTIGSAPAPFRPRFLPPHFPSVPGDDSLYGRPVAFAGETIYIDLRVPLGYTRRGALILARQVGIFLDLYC